MKISCADWQKKQNNKNKITVVLANPRSGSTLLLRLLNRACSTPVIGDRPASFFAAWLQLRASLKEGGPIYGHLGSLEDQSVFPDEFRAHSSAEAEENMTDYYLRSLLLGGSSGWMKSTMIGFGNSLVKPFLDTLRELCDTHDIQLQTVFLTRPKEEILKSLEEKSEKLNIKFPGCELGQLIDSQNQQFKDAYEFGDKNLTYQELVADPFEAVLKNQPRYYPNQYLIDQVMKKKLR